MDPFLGWLVLIGIIYAAGVAAEKARHQRLASQGTAVRAAERAAAPAPLLPAARKAVVRQHKAAWWASELAHGFPVFRTHLHTGWLAHEAAAAQAQGSREMARLERDSFRDVVTAYKENRATARKEIEDAIAASPVEQDGSREAVREAARDAVILPFARKAPPAPEPEPAPEPGPYAVRADARPGDSSWLLPGQKRCPECDGSGANKARDDACPACRGFGSAPPDPDGPADVPGTICTACGKPGTEDDPVLIDGLGRTHRSHVLPRITATQGEPAMASDTTYTSVLTAAKAFHAAADADIATIRQRHIAAMNMADEMQGHDVDAASLSEVFELLDRLAEAEKALAAVGEQATVVQAGLSSRHGNLDEAHQNSPVRAAQRDFYEGQ